MVNRLGKYAVMGVGGFVALLVVAAVLGWWMIPLGLLAAIGLAGWVSKTLLPTWREKHEWYEPKGAAGRVAHGVATFFVSVWFAGAVLARGVAGRALLFWLAALLVVDYVWFDPYSPEPVAPWVVGWLGFGALGCAYGYFELRNQRKWEQQVLKAHTALPGQIRREDVPVRFRGRTLGGMDYRFDVPPRITRKDLFGVEQRLRQRVPTHRRDLLSVFAKKYPASLKRLKALEGALEDQKRQRSRTWRYTWDLEEGVAQAEVVPGIPELAEHPLVANPNLRGDPDLIPLGISLDGEEYWDVRDLYGAGFMAVGQSRGGKSVALRAIIVWCMAHSDHWDITLIDPKVVEFSPFRKFPQVGRVATDLTDMEEALREAVAEMERRYVAIAEYEVQKIAELNERLRADGKPPLKRLLVCVDEALDLLETSGGKDEESKYEYALRQACRKHLTTLVRKGAGAGVHTAIGPQRPDANIIGGQIRNNIQARAAIGGMSPAGSRMALDDSLAATELPGIQGRAIFFESGREKQMQVYWTPMDAVRRIAGVQEPKKDAPDREDEAA